MREGEAPSYFNAEEAAALVELVEGLIAQTNGGGRRGVQANDLGIIATYRKQVRQIVSLLERVLLLLHFHRRHVTSIVIWSCSRLRRRSLLPSS